MLIVMFVAFVLGYASDKHTTASMLHVVACLWAIAANITFML